VESGSLRPGDRLPSERDLSEQLGVSRGTVREAVQFLQALGLLEVRHGSGTVVSRQSHDRQALQTLWRDWTAGNMGRIRELLEVRRGLDAFATELAARRQIPEALQSMADAIEQMRAAVRDEDVTTGVDADAAFHRAVGEATGNVALVDLVESIGRQLVQERAALWSAASRPQRSLAEHTEIYDAIRAGDPARARAAALAHLQSIEQEIGELTHDQGGPA
jgi:GntR family transcriptional repressor for pyruvate dehydrogenase complex